MSSPLDAVDWSATPLGPKAAWPAALRSSHDTLMGIGFPACIVWGDALTLLYNEAFIPILGARHPWAVGKPFPEVWSEVWPQIGPLVDRTLAGERVYLENFHLLMTRNGYPEDTWWTFSYSPLRDGDRISGLLDIAVETTGQVRADEERAVLLGETNHRLKNSMAIVQAIARQSLKSVGDLEAVRNFEDRLQALAGAHDLLLQTEWSQADLGALVEVALGRVAHPDRFDLQGAAAAGVGARRPDRVAVGA